MIPQQQSDILNILNTKAKANIYTTQLHRCASEYPSAGLEENSDIGRVNGSK